MAQLFFDGVATIAEESITSAHELFVLVTQDRDRILSNGLISVSAIRLFERLPHHPIVTVTTAMNLVNVSKPTAMRAISILEDIGVLVESTGRKRNRSFTYQAYLDQLRADTDLESI